MPNFKFLWLPSYSHNTYLTTDFIHPCPYFASEKNYLKIILTNVVYFSKSCYPSYMVHACMHFSGDLLPHITSGPKC
jgi:hypothetical protein